MVFQLILRRGELTRKHEIEKVSALLRDTLSKRRRKTAQTGAKSKAQASEGGGASRQSAAAVKINAG